jgi:uncharacterized protein YecT (DUF1311 family)
MWSKVALLVLVTCLMNLPARAERLLEFGGVTVEAAVSPAYAACFNAAGGSDSRIAECMSAEAKLWDRRLNVAYGALRTRLNKNEFATLQAFQRAWIAERDATCRDTGENGTMGRVVAASCNLRFTVLRAVELEMRAASGG